MNRPQPTARLRVQHFTPLQFLTAKLSSLSGLIAALVLLTASCSSGPATVQVDGDFIIAFGEGKSSIYFKDTGLAAQRAREQAMRDAVAKAIGQTLRARTETANMQFMSEEISLKAAGLIRSYDILEEKTTDGGSSYFMRIKAWVYKTRLNDSFEELLNEIGNPRMMFLIEETINRNRQKALTYSPGSTFSEIAIGEKLQQKGIKFVDKNNVEDLARKNAAAVKKALNGQSADALKISRSMADVLIIGSGETRDAGELSDMGISGGRGMYSAQASLRLKVLEAGSGNVIAQETINTASVHINRVTAAQHALAKAGRGIIPRLMPKIRDYFLKKPRNNEFELNLVGLQAGSTELLAFKSLLLSTTRVRAIHAVRGKGKLVVWRLTYPGNSEKLVEELTAKQKQMGFSLKLLEYNLSSLNYQISQDRKL